MKKTAPIAAIFFIVIAVWSVTLGGGFVYDDHKYLVGNPWVKDIAFIGDIFSSSTAAFSPGDVTSNTYRPLLFILYLAEYLAFGLDPFYYHLVNVAAHAVNSVLVFFVASNLLERKGQKNAMPALFAALAFGLHTVNSEVVNWVSASPELFFTLFALLGLNLYIRGWYRPLAAPFFFCGLLFKETAAALPVLAALHDLSSGAYLRDRWKAYVLFIAAAAAYAVMRLNAIGGLMHHKQVSLTAFEAVINIFPLVLSYAAKLVFPSGLSVIYSFHSAHSVADPRVLAGAAVAAAFCVALFFTRKRPALFVGLSMMAVPILPVLYVPALSSSAMADRYLYLPSAGFAIVLASSASMLGRKAAMAAAVAGLALVVAWAAGSISRSSVWKSDYTLWADAVGKAPYAPNAHYNYAWAARNAGDLKGAVEHYRIAGRLAPSADVHYNLGLIFMGQSMLDEAEAEFMAALRLDPGVDEARARLMDIRRMRGEDK